MTGREPPLSGAVDLPQGCPGCGAAMLEMRWALAAKPLGTHSLSGGQLKVSALVRARVSCEACAWSVQGGLEGATMSADGTGFTGGHFVADGPQEGLSDGGS